MPVSSSYIIRAYLRSSTLCAQTDVNYQIDVMARYE